MRTSNRILAVLVSAAVTLAASTGVTLAQSATGGGGGGGGGTTPSTSTGVTVGAAGAVSASSLTGTGPTSVSATVSVASGGTIIAGNVGVSLPPGFVGIANANVSITPTLPPGINIAALAGSVIGSPNGTAFDLSVTDPTTGAQITSFNTPVTFTILPNAADVAIANGNYSILTVIYFTAPNTLPVFNTLGFPANTPLFQPSVTHNPDNTLSWSNQNGAGVVQAIVANPLTYVQTVNAGVQEYSSFDPASGQSFGGKSQFSYLQVTEPQIPGVNRLVVLDPDTGNYSYVNATDVGPSGPPPAKTAAGVVRGLVQ